MISDRCCGNCMYHVPKKNCKKIYTLICDIPLWKCGLSDVGTYADEGADCLKFKNRYTPKDKSEDWLKNVYSKDELLEIE